jgi:hypothetical protein
MTKSKSQLEPTKYLNSPDGSGKPFWLATPPKSLERTAGTKLIVGQPSFAPKFLKKST